MISFAIIGLGNIGIRHLAHILANPMAELVAVCDINEQQKERVPDGVAFYSNPDDFFTEVKATVINVCTPNYLHLTHAVNGMKSGAHVIVEKPMALSVQECDTMMDAAATYDKTIFAVKQNRYNPPVQLVKKLIQDKSLGEIFMVQVNCFWNRNDQYYAAGDWRGKRTMDGGCLFTQFSHFIDILYYLIGNVEAVSGSIHNFLHQHNTEFEDTGSFILKATNGAIINFNFTTNAFEKNMEGSITLMGSDGLVKIGGQYLNTIEYSKIANQELPNINIHAKENDYGTYKGSMSNHDKMIQNVIDVLHHQEPIMTTAAQGKEVVRIIESMYQICK